jgi:multidrug efflux pump subunit AcrA (membrane-fusion protein)
MKQHIVSLPHHPKRVIIISLLIAIAIGSYSYIKINKKTDSAPIQNTSNTNTNSVQNISLGFLTGGRIKSVYVHSGDVVKKGQILATLDAENTLGVLTQAKAAYQTAEANYKKIITGATSPAIDVAKSAVNAAQVNLDGVTKQQDLLVSNAHINLLNSTITPVLSNSNNSITPPSITGTYNKEDEGSITFAVYQTGNGGYVSFSGMVNGTTPISTTSPQPIGDTGLYIEFPSVSPYASTSWIIDIPNKTAPDYLANYNAYQSALQTKDQAVSNAQASLDQARASLNALVASARPEDIAVSQAQIDSAAGAVQIAESAYNNTIITAPSDGTIVSVAITPGQIAVPNASAIEFTSN